MYEEPGEPTDEAERLCTLHSLNVLDTPPEERFDRFTRLARRLFRVPIALVSLVDRDRQWFKSRQGLDVTETPRAISFCGHAILGSEPFVVEDTRCDARFAGNPLVTDAPNIRFYAGCPLQAPDGSKLGTLCLIDREPRNMQEEDLEVLNDLTKMVESELSALCMATTDDLTGLSNRRGFEVIASKALSLCDRVDGKATLLYLDLDGFKAINDTFGHAAGDQILKDAAELLLANFRESDVVARLGGDEFCVLLTGPAAMTPNVPLERFARAVQARNTAGPDIAYSAGSVDYRREQHGSLAALLDAADRHMYEHKRSRRAA